MFKKQIGLCLIATLGLLHLSAASAAVVSFNPSSQTVNRGDPVSVDLVISELGADILTGFDLDISFDDSILGFQSFTVGPGATGLDPFGLDFGFFSSGSEDSPGIVTVGDLSVETDATLQAFQPNNFVLGTLNFNALNQVGTSSLVITSALLSGEFDALGIPTVLQAKLNTGSVSVVPVPAAVWLFGSALLGLVGFSRRKRAAAGH